MEINVETSLQTEGSFECRSGKCPDCETSFDNTKESRGALRYCPKCKEHKLGNIKSVGKIT